MSAKRFALGLLPLFLLAFSPAEARAGEADLAIRITTTVNTSGSGTLDAQVSISQTAIDWFRSLGMPQAAANTMCSAFVVDADKTITWKQEDQPAGGTLCSAEIPFADLDELKSLSESLFTGGTFARLEISGGRFYYDLAANTTFTSDFGPMSMITLAADWIVKVPGDLVDSNADEVNGRVLTWDLTKVKAGDHLQAESKIGGGGLAGLDPTASAIAAGLLLCCCCVVLLIAAVAAFLLLRRRNRSAAK
jgi:hypothetical protein